MGALRFQTHDAVDTHHGVVRDSRGQVQPITCLRGTAVPASGRPKVIDPLTTRITL